MFDFGWDEMALIGVVALIVIGPKDLPKVMRQAGRWMRRAREMAAEFQHGIEDMAHQAEMEELRKDVAATVDPNGIKRDIEEAVMKADSAPAAPVPSAPPVPPTHIPPEP